MKKRKKFFVNFIKIQNLNMGPSFLLVTLVIAGALSSSWPVHPAVCWSAESGRGGDDCLHRHNPHPGVPPNISTYTGEPVFVRQVKNGKLYLGGSGNDTFHIVHLWSSRYKKKQRKKERMLSFFLFFFFGFLFFSHWFAAIRQMIFTLWDTRTVSSCRRNSRPCLQEFQSGSPRCWNLQFHGFPSHLLS